MNRLICNSMLAILMLSGLIAATGCGRYVLQGKVVTGAASSVQVVQDDDPRLAGPPVAGARIKVTLDPRSLGRKELGTTTSSHDGSFSLSIDEAGAGLLEYELGFVARIEKHNSAVGQVKMPSSRKRILIILAPGKDLYIEPDDPLKGFDQYSK